MSQGDTVEVDKNDLLTAWAVLENLAVSLDHIGNAFSEELTTVVPRAAELPVGPT
jgi:hypothetical protein